MNSYEGFIPPQFTILRDFLTKSSGTRICLRFTTLRQLFRSTFDSNNGATHVIIHSMLGVIKFLYLTLTFVRKRTAYARVGSSHQPLQNIYIDTRTDKQDLSSHNWTYWTIHNVCKEYLLKLFRLHLLNSYFTHDGLIQHQKCWFRNEVKNPYFIHCKI